MEPEGFSRAVDATVRLKAPFDEAQGGARL
jgi:hypothetical protein